MKTPQSQILAVMRYRKEKRDNISVDVPKGKRDEYKAKAAALGMSLTALIQRGVESYGGEGVQKNTPVKPAGTVLTHEQRKILDAVESLPPDARRALLKILYTLQQSVAEKATVD